MLFALQFVGVLVLGSAGLGAPPSAAPVKAGSSAAVSKPTLPSEWVKQFKWRCIGPAAMGGRITAISAYNADPTTYYVGLAEGGLLKTTNAGNTFEHVFDHEGSSSVGSVCVAPTDENVVWVGTGEANPRNSVSFGDGVYKSTDGGKTWKCMGLKDTFQIGKILISPKDPNTVYVGALGRLWGPNKERGLYKTTDGGETWKQVLYIDDKTGVIDMVMNPDDPDSLVVATWERLRDGYDSHPGKPALPEGYDSYDPIVKYGKGGGLYKTTDGGKTFRKLTQGLPTNETGRIGLDMFAKNPKVLFAIVDCEKMGMGPAASKVYIGIYGQDQPGGVKLTSVTDGAPAAKAGLREDDVVTLVDGKPVGSYEKLLAAIQARKAGDVLTLTMTRDGKPMQVKVTVADRPVQGNARPPSLGRILMARTQDADNGVRVLDTFDEGAADAAGIAEGDVITEVAKTKVAGSQALLDKLKDLKAGSKVKLTVIHEGKPKTVELEIQEPRFGGFGNSATRPFGAELGGQRQNVQDRQGASGFEYGGIFRSDDFGETWKRINSLDPRPMYFSVVRVDPSDDKYLYVLGIEMYRSSDGGKTFTSDGANRVHADQHDLWIDPKDGRHMVVGTDGGYYVTYDRMDHWDHLSSVAIGQFYDVKVDNSHPYRVVGGLQDNGAWLGPTMSTSEPGPVSADWMVLGGGDGFQAAVDPNDTDLFYTESQDGSIDRQNVRTGESGSIRPRRETGKKYRFNWNTPFAVSSHNPGIFYSVGNYVFKSIKRGDDLRTISPEITRTGNGTGTAFSESPRNPDVLWVGTDDGYLWVTRDGGLHWTNVAAKVGLKGPRWVASVEASRFAEGRAYVAFDGHRSDDDAPYLYVTEDLGETWKPIVAGLPQGSTRCLREDIKNPDLLYVGTEFASWVSIDRGQTWTQFNNNLPTVKVFNYAIHPTAGEIVAATHGRSLWIVDVTALRQMSAATVAEPAHLYEPNTVVRWRNDPEHGSLNGEGFRKYYGENPPRGARFYYSLGADAREAKIVVYDVAGNVVRQLNASTDAGLHVVSWDLTRAAARPQGAGPGGPGGAATDLPPMGPGGFGFGRAVSAGSYKVVLTVDGKDYIRVLRVENDPTLAQDQLARENPIQTRGDDDQDDTDDDAPVGPSG
jgi:photosystem II stability/assembly factor-like uncharacterized protein